jgi:hypothetical protein
VVVSAVRAHLGFHSGPAGRVTVVTRRRIQPLSAPDTATAAAEFLSTQEITRTQCGQCGTEIHGINGRYACAGCGWVSHWAEGHNQLPTADDDPDA